MVPAAVGLLPILLMIELEAELPVPGPTADTYRDCIQAAQIFELEAGLPVPAPTADTFETVFNPPNL